MTKPLPLAALSFLLLCACTGPSTDDPVDTDTDPTDGYPWPRSDNKSDLGEPDPDTIWPSVGAEVPHVVAEDQFGNSVDLYDFYQADRPLVVEFVTGNLDPSRELAAELSGQASTHDGGPLDGLDAAVEAGRYWHIRVLVVGYQGVDADAVQLSDWDERFPQDASPLLLDEDFVLWRYFIRFSGQTGQGSELPGLIRIDPDTFRVQEDPTVGLGILEAIMAE